MIITQISRPTARLTRAISKSAMAAAAPGRSWPRPMPAPMQASTQSVSQRSKKPSSAGAVCIACRRRLRADAIELALDPQPVQRGERQVHEAPDAVLERAEG